MACYCSEWTLPCHMESWGVTTQAWDTPLHIDTSSSYNLDPAKFVAVDKNLEGNACEPALQIAVPTIPYHRPARNLPISQPRSVKRKLAETAEYAAPPKRRRQTVRPTRRQITRDVHPYVMTSSFFLPSLQTTTPIRETSLNASSGSCLCYECSTPSAYPFQNYTMDSLAQCCEAFPVTTDSRASFALPTFDFSLFPPFYSEVSFTDRFGR